MVNIIIVFPKREVILKMKNILVKNGLEVAATCLTGAQAIQAVERLEAGVIVSGIRYSDMLYYELKDCVPDTFEMMVVATSAQWQQYGGDDVVYLPLPMKAYDLVEMVSDLYNDVSRRLRRAAEKPKERSSDEKGIIGHAKDILMERYGYTEEEAHRYLQKHSMDSGNNMVDTAYMVLDIF